MTDLSDLVPIIAKQLGMAPSTLLLLLIVVNRVANIVSRKIPNDATGWRATARTIASIVGTDTSSVVTTTPDGRPVTVQDVAAQAATTPPITQKVAAAAATKEA